MAWRACDSEIWLTRHGKLEGKAGQRGQRPMEGDSASLTWLGQTGVVDRYTPNLKVIGFFRL